MKKAVQFRMNVMDSFIAGLEREIRWAEGDLEKISPEDFKKPEIREELMELMSEVQRSKEMVNAYNESKKSVLSEDKAKPEVSGTQSIGFMNFKEAA